MTSSKLHLIGKYVIVARYKKFLLYSTQFSVPAFLSCGERSFQTKCSCNVEHTGLAEVFAVFLVFGTVVSDGEHNRPGCLVIAALYQAFPI